MRRVWVWVMLVGALGCDRLPGSENSAKEGTRSDCRRACGQTYKECAKACQNDAPAACEGRCDMNNKRCNERCEAP